MADYGSDAPSATPPVLPPKPGSHEASGISTPTTYGSNGLPLPSGSAADPSLSSTPAGTGEFHQVAGPPDPGDHWLPKILEDKSYVSRDGHAPRQPPPPAKERERERESDHQSC